MRGSVPRIRISSLFALTRRNRSRSRELMLAMECAEAKPRRRTPAASEDSRCQASKRMPPTCTRVSSSSAASQAKGFGARTRHPQRRHPSQFLRRAFRRAALSGVSREWVTPARSATGPVLLYLHGGGYFTGCARAHRPINGQFCDSRLQRVCSRILVGARVPLPRGRR